MVDNYTKIVLTVIAAALVVLAAERFAAPASAQLGEGCGIDPARPCYVQGTGISRPEDAGLSSSESYLNVRIVGSGVHLIEK